MEEVRANIKEAVDCYFDEIMHRPKLIHPHFGHDEIWKYETSSDHSGSHACCTFAPCGHKPYLRLLVRAA